MQIETKDPDFLDFIKQPLPFYERAFEPVKEAWRVVAAIFGHERGLNPRIIYATAMVSEEDQTVYATHYKYRRASPVWSPIRTRSTTPFGLERSVSSFWAAAAASSAPEPSRRRRTGRHPPPAPAGLLDALLHHPAVPAQHLRVGIPEGLEQPRGALDVGEEEGEGLLGRQPPPTA